MIIFWLFVAGLLRGVVETLWLYLMKGQFNEFVSSLGSLDWYLFNSGPFIICNIPSTFFLWSLTALIVYESGKFLGGKGEFDNILRIYGIAMFSYFLIGILNYFHYYVDIPMIRFRASEIFNPDLGLGQILVFIWLVVITFQISRKVHLLSKMESLLIALLPISLGIVLYIFSVRIFFDVMFPILNLNMQPFLLSLIIYTISTFFLSFLFVYAGYTHK